METYETNPDFARVSFLRNTKSAALGVSGFEKRNIRVPRTVSPAIRLYISFLGSDAAIADVPQRPERKGLDDPIELVELTAALPTALLLTRCQ